MNCEGESREEMRARARDSFIPQPPPKPEYVEINGLKMTRGEWKMFMDHCPHEHFSHPEVYLMDGSRMSICDRCKVIQLEPIAKMLEEGDF